VPRVLIVSPHFPPVNAPDLQRVRMSLPYFVEAGWEPVVLTVDDREPIAPLEPDLLATVPASVRVVRAPCWSRRWTRLIGVGNIALRALPFLHRAGRRLLAERPFDLVFFSTTQFAVLPLGRLWQRRYGVPYVIDLQDPWRNDYYRRPGAPRPPGGWKYRFADLFARCLEGWTLRRAARVISVSERYLDDLGRRYPWWSRDRGSVVTFGAPDRDFRLAREKAAQQQPLLPATPDLKIVYAGRLGADMLPALDALFTAVAARRREPRPAAVYFFGTTYAARDEARPITSALAGRHGITDLVHEFPARIGYLDSLRVMLEGDVALLLGSDDAGYSPSKIYPTLLSGRPALAIGPAGGVLAEKIEELGGAGSVTFPAGAPRDGAAQDQIRVFLAQAAGAPGAPLGAPLRRDVLESRYSAAAIATRQLGIFAEVVSARSPAPR